MNILVCADSLDVMRSMSESSIDAIVTDPPYGWRFMGKAWDGEDIEKENKKRIQEEISRKGYSDKHSPALSAGQYEFTCTANKSFQAWTEQWAKEALRILKPGGHMLVFCGPRTYHRMAAGVEDAGFEIRDMLQWNFGSGFPKSHSINKDLIKRGLICECKNKVHGMSKADHEVGMLDQETENSDMQSSMQGQNEIRKSAVHSSSNKDCFEHERSQKSTSVWTEESGLEGRSDVQTHQGELHRAEICKMSEGIFRDESQGRLCNGASADNSETSSQNADENGSSSSCGSQHKKQSSKQFGTLADKSDAQTSGAWPRCDKCGKQILPNGLGTALKPAHESIVLARKPLSEKTVAANVLKWGVGGLNIDACRIEGIVLNSEKRTSKAGKGLWNLGDGSHTWDGKERHNPQGRWPANLLLSEQAAFELDEQTGDLGKSTGGRTVKRSGKYEDGKVSAKGEWTNEDPGYGDSGGPSRFFYCSKTSKSERNAGLEGMPERLAGAISGKETRPDRPPNHTMRANHHPTVKPIKLMQYLCKLITPPNGIILDPFMGSGSTGVAAKRLGFQFIGIDKEKEYFDIAKKRLWHG